MSQTISFPYFICETWPVKIAEFYYGYTIPKNPTIYGWNLNSTIYFGLLLLHECHYRLPYRCFFQKFHSKVCLKFYFKLHRKCCVNNLNHTYCSRTWDEKNPSLNLIVMTSAGSQLKLLQVSSIFFIIDPIQ